MSNNIKDILSVPGIVLFYFFLPVGIQALVEKMSATTEFDAGFNTERQKRGVLPLPEHWVLKDNYPPMVYIPADSPNLRTRKIVVVEDDEIVSEVDYLHKGNYGMEVIYHYRKYENPWEITIDNSDSSWLITKAQADSVFSEWEVY